MINVLHLTNSLNYGGLERVVIDICRHLDKSQFRPMVACIRWKGPQAELLADQGIPVVVLKNRSSFMPKHSTFLELKKVIKENHIDIIHSHNTGPLLDAIAARFVSISFPKIVHTDHNRVKWPDKSKYMFFERIASRVVSSFVAVSEDAKNNLVFFEKIPADVIKVVDNGISVEAFQQFIGTADVTKRELDLQRFKYVIGGCAVLRKQKGITYLLQAMPEIIKEVPSVCCVIGGHGTEREALEALVSELGIEEHVRFIGPRDDVEKILPIYDVFVLPSESEGLPLSLLEAMAAKRCIVATSVGAVPKALEDGRCGILVPPKDSEAISAAVVHLLKSPEDRNRFSFKAFRCVNENYSASAMAMAYAEIYKRSLGANLYGGFPCGRGKVER
ncbi:glycosyltransferase [Geomonas agri]|uniref:glycosyltransferase n=1 Tax=Geomonas agri TaxID=2873702 RepID=UPI001CD569F2|nr:glycosyltransferase [Geomonas agri]